MACSPNPPPKAHSIGFCPVAPHASCLPLPLPLSLPLPPCRADIATATMDNLTDATMLIAELTSKLAELDRKVSVYRLGMAAEFTKYSEQLLENVPQHVAYQVSRAIEDSLPNFPSLYPPGSQQPSPSTTAAHLEEIAWHGNKSPPPILPHTSGQPKAPQNNAALRPSQSIQRERDQEFSGLFVPSYLPLLESVDRPSYLPTTSPNQATDTAGLPNTAKAEPAPSSDERNRPGPLRRTTDTSISSAASDTSSVKTRKSALRRSSSSFKPDSPRDSRRVRFDFEGEEVLPSSSPHTSTDTLAPAGAVRSAQENPASANDSYTASIGDIQGEQDEHPEKPKKVSSSQALRALSKAPLDEGTVWTVVNPGTGSEESSDTDKIRDRPESNSVQASSLVSHTTEKMVSTDNQSNTTHGTPRSGPKQELQPEKRATATMDESEEEQFESDDEPALFMVSKRGLKKKSKGTSAQVEKETDSYATKLYPSPRLINPSTAAASSPAASASSTAATNKPTIAEEPVRPVGKAMGAVDGGAKTKVETGPKNVRLVADSTEDDDDDFFTFDGDEKGGNKTKKYLPETHDEDEEPVEEVAAHPATKTHQTQSDHSSSPPMTVPSQEGLSLEHRIPKKVPSQPEGTRQFSVSIGSLGNRPLTPGPVKDAKLLEEVSKIDVEVPFFVGSVNGRSGPDASNVKSYQASLMSPTQVSGSFASGSFAERLMWEKSQGILYDSDAEDLSGDKDHKNGRQHRR